MPIRKHSSHDTAAALVAAGVVQGPASATDNAVARFDGTTGKLIQNSTAILSDAGALSTTSVDGGSTASGVLTISSTSNATKGYISMPDASAMVLGTGSAGVQDVTTGAGATPGATRPLIIAANTGATQFNMVSAGNPNILITRVGTSVAAPTAAASGVNLGVIAFRGYPGTGSIFSSNNSGQITVVSEETISSTASGARLSLFTAQLTTTTLTERLRLDSGGQVSLFSTTSANLIWNTDGSGSIGATGANRPLDIFAAGNIVAEVAGKGLKIKEGSNARMGTATLSGGTIVVSNTSVTANSRIFLTKQETGTLVALGSLRVSARTAATSFTISSDNAIDTSDVAWMIIEPA